LVGDFEGGIRRMLDFIGEPFDERCASFHQSPRLPQTPSYSQVSEKLYDRSLNRYLNSRSHLGTVAAILAPVISRLGYSLDL
jgi:hypothetical protein